MDSEAITRFESKFIPVPESGCWIWLAATSQKGYGQFKLNGRMHAAHRVSYELYRGRIPEGLGLDHLCRVRCCVNPDHLEPVTDKVNCHRGFSLQAMNMRKTYCVNGHPLAGLNLQARPDGGRRCRACKYRDDTWKAYKRQRRRNWQFLYVAGKLLHAKEQP